MAYRRSGYFSFASPASFRPAAGAGQMPKPNDEYSTPGAYHWHTCHWQRRPRGVRMHRRTVTGTCQVAARRLTGPRCTDALAPDRLGRYPVRALLPPPAVEGPHHYRRPHGPRYSAWGAPALMRYQMPLRHAEGMTGAVVPLRVAAYRDAPQHASRWRSRRLPFVSHLQRKVRRKAGCVS